jgi:hypothetical protein
VAQAKTFDELMTAKGHVLEKKFSVAKVDGELGLVFGWGIICEKDGAEYYDSQGDHIPFDVMLKGTSEFMANARVAKDMHSGEQIGAIVHSMPLTPEVAKAFKIDSSTYGWMVAMQPSADVLKQFKSGERTGFSIGGMCNYELEAA